jgi:DNA-binding transcriptional regulator YiaG
METRRGRARPKWDSRHVRALRSHLGLTQQELADQLGTRQQTISEWEKGLYQPRGASSTLLTMVAERARFRYDADGDRQESEGDLPNGRKNERPALRE